MPRRPCREWPRDTRVLAGADQEVLVRLPHVHWQGTHLAFDRPVGNTNYSLSTNFRLELIEPSSREGLLNLKDKYTILRKSRKIGAQLKIPRKCRLEKRYQRDIKRTSARAQSKRTTIIPTFKKMVSPVCNVWMYLLICHPFSLLFLPQDETYTVVVKGKPLATIKADLIHAFLSVNQQFLSLPSSS